MDTSSKKIKNLPHTPGIYQFRNRENIVIYVGKAKDLKARVTSYFRKNRLTQTKTLSMINQINSLTTIQTASEFDAILLEAKLIRDLKPKYNIISKDDKSPLYIQITKHEQLPRLLFVRKDRESKGITFGPFQSARVARSLVHDLRPIIPYCTQKIRNGKPCFYTHLNLCNPCPSEISKMEDGTQKKQLIQQYRKNMLTLIKILSGKSRTLKNTWIQNMERASSRLDYEQAAILRDRIGKLTAIIERHYDPSLYISGDQQIEYQYEKERNELMKILLPTYPTLHNLTRIECIDISNMNGKQATGSLVVVINSQPDPRLYRRFRIKTIDTPNDVAMISEVVTRRLHHPEWQFPNLFVVDGGKTQLAIAIHILKKFNIHIPVIGLAKREEQIVVQEKTGFRLISLDYTNPALLLLKRIRDEAHRFAIKYHRNLFARSR